MRTATKSVSNADVRIKGVIKHLYKNISLSKSTTKAIQKAFRRPEARRNAQRDRGAIAEPVTQEDKLKTASEDLSAALAERETAEAALSVAKRQYYNQKRKINNFVEEMRRCIDETD